MILIRMALCRHSKKAATGQSTQEEEEEEEKPRSVFLFDLMTGKGSGTYVR